MCQVGSEEDLLTLGKQVVPWEAPGFCSEPVRREQKILDPSGPPAPNSASQASVFVTRFAYRILHMILLFLKKDSAF